MTAADPKNDPRRKRLAIYKGILVFLVVAVIAGQLSDHGGEDATPGPSDMDRTFYAKRAAERAIEQALLSPSSAEFETIPSVIFVPDRSAYLVEGYVDSQNDFGAVVRQAYVAKVDQVCDDVEDRRCLRVDEFTLDGASYRP